MTCIIFSYILQVPGYPDYYNIVYDRDIAVYVYKLLEDYKAGDLKVLVQQKGTRLIFDIFWNDCL